MAAKCSTSACDIIAGVHFPYRRHHAHRQPRFVNVDLFASLIFAQIAPTESEKEKNNKETDERVVKLLDDAIAEGGSLRLPQNGPNGRDRRPIYPGRFALNGEALRGSGIFKG